MSDDRNEPREYDAVIGGQNSIPVNAAILGGIPGVKSRLASPIVEVRIVALSEAIKYGEAGLELIMQALHDESMQVKFAAYSLLKDRDDLKLKPQFQNYLPTFEFDVITVDIFGRNNSRIKSLAPYFPEDLGNGIILDMVYIPGGTFIMGSPAKEKGRRDNESPQHQVTVSAFYAGKYPITQEQWQAVMGSNPSYYYEAGEKRPVNQVSWYDAVEFCRKLSEKTGQSYRLLSEAEWEYACRARTKTPFYFGKRITSHLVNHYGIAFNGLLGIYHGHTTDVDSFPPNAFGLYDMHGNASEWCSDRWHENYNGAPTDGSSWDIGTHNCRVKRGGTLSSKAVDCRSAFRSYHCAGKSDSTSGFRVAAVLCFPSSRSSL